MSLSSCKLKRTAAVSRGFLVAAWISCKNSGISLNSVTILWDGMTTCIVISDFHLEINIDNRPMTSVQVIGLICVQLRCSMYYVWAVAANKKSASKTLKHFSIPNGQ